MFGLYISDFGLAIITASILAASAVRNKAPKFPGFSNPSATKIKGFLDNFKSDMYNPNIVRSSVGCLFTRQIAVATSEEAIAYLKENNINIYCATLQDSTPYHSQNYNEPTALVVGTEATGITEIWRENSTKNINIPMQGSIDSMNVSVAAAILLFEAKRQRGF